MGCDEREGGSVTLTDDDVIEVSNLSRQFLFRSGDVGKPKSGAAASAARAMNPDMNVCALQSRVSDKTENVFDAAFWVSQSRVGLLSTHTIL